ncbi:MAG: hypothetical protein LAT76_00775, partial [Schleiferiaceae bacterium]|nr:hypothetical protein [Schleiferiaceae bacterium]
PHGVLQLPLVAGALRWSHASRCCGVSATIPGGQPFTHVRPGGGGKPGATAAIEAWPEGAER